MSQFDQLLLYQTEVMVHGLSFMGDRTTRFLEGVVISSTTTLKRVRCLQINVTLQRAITFCHVQQQKDRGERPSSHIYTTMSKGSVTINQCHLSNSAELKYLLLAKTEVHLLFYLRKLGNFFYIAQFVIKPIITSFRILIHCTIFNLHFITVYNHII